MPVKCHLRIVVGEFHMEGFEAVDFVRKMGIYEACEMRGCHEDPNFQAGAEVPETFARTWFGGNIDAFEAIDVDLFQPGELGSTGVFPASKLLGVSPDNKLTPQRVMELYVAQRVRNADIKLNQES